jgi:hypothetical protein
MSAANEHKVVDLVDAGVPADHGLASLGLLMQLAGSLFAAAAALVAFVGLQLGHDILWIFVLSVASIGRSMAHRSAGTCLLYAAEGSDRMAGIRRYIAIGLGHAVLFGLVLTSTMHAPLRMALGLTAGFAVWPATLAVLLALPRFKRYRNALPIAEDKGFEGASILMSVLGMCGAVATASLLIVLLELPSRELQSGPTVLVVLALGMLFVRSVLHVQAGSSGLRETSVDRSVELSNRYANFGVISAFCMAGALLLFMMANAANVEVLAAISAMCWMLMAWPTVIRRFYGDRQFADLLAGDGAPLHRRAPDAGLTSLGWLLIGHAALTASFLLPEMVVETGHTTLGQLLSLGGALGLHSLWWSVGLVVLEAWAGYELIRMSPQSRAIATVFGVVGVAVTAYLNWPLLQGLQHLSFSDPSAAMAGPVAFDLILPVATIVLVNRAISPTARARLRSRPAPAAG